MMRTAVIPGSFDPITNGHLDVIGRAAGMFDGVIVAMAQNSSKTPLFTLNERIVMVVEACADWPNVSVDAFTGLLVDYALSREAHVIVKGLRAVSDFEYEFQMALMNRRLSSRVETVFLMTGAEHSYLSSSIVKEIAGLGGSVKGLVPESVEERLREKVAGKHDGQS